MQLFYQPELNSSATSVTFDKNESRHLIKSLRKKIGDSIAITNGKGLLFDALLTDDNEKKCIAEIQSITETKKNRPYRLHIAIAPTKLNDRFEWFLEKATEIGVDEITPILCDHSERKIYKKDRGEKIIQAAAKQSLKTFFPRLNELTALKKVINNNNATFSYIAHCEEGKKPHLKELIKDSKDILILIGPEGDFSTQEIKMALKNNFQAISLGEERLRTETAGLVACTTVSISHS